MSDGQAAVLSADQREVLGQALGDALGCRTWRSPASSGSRGNGDRAMQPEGDDGMSDKRVSETTDDQVRDLADAMGTWKPDAYHQARQAIMHDARVSAASGPFV